MTKKRVFKKSEIKAPPDKFSCRKCGCDSLRTTHVFKGDINVEDDKGNITKEEVKKRYRDCQGCGTRFVTFESIIYEVNRRNVKFKKQSK